MYPTVAKFPADILAGTAHSLLRDSKTVVWHPETSSLQPSFLSVVIPNGVCGVRNPSVLFYPRHMEERFLASLGMTNPVVVFRSLLRKLPQESHIALEK